MLVIILLFLSAGVVGPLAGIRPDTEHTTPSLTHKLQPTAGRLIYLDDRQKPTVPDQQTSTPGSPISPLQRKTLKVEQNKGKGGGFYVDLQGKYLVYSTATIQPDGSVKVGCYRNPIIPHSGIVMNQGSHP